MNVLTGRISVSYIVSLDLDDQSLTYYNATDAKQYITILGTRIPAE